MRPLCGGQYRHHLPPVLLAGIACSFEFGDTVNKYLGEELCLIGDGFFMSFFFSLFFALKKKERLSWFVMSALGGSGGEM